MGALPYMEVRKAYPSFYNLCSDVNPYQDSSKTYMHYMDWKLFRQAQHVPIMKINILRIAIMCSTGAMQTKKARLFTICKIVRYKSTITRQIMNDNKIESGNTNIQ